MSSKRWAALGVAAALVLGGTGCSDDGSSTGSADASDDGGGTTEAVAWTDADLERLVTIPIDGFTAGDGNVTEFGNATVTYTEADPSGPVALQALVTFTTCDPFTCFDLTQELDAEQADNLRSTLPPVHIDNPDLVEEMGPTELGGREAFSVYFRSFVDEGDGQATANRSTTFVHDGTNLITVQVVPSFDEGLADSAAELEEQMDAEAATAVADRIVAGLDAELA